MNTFEILPAQPNQDGGWTVEYSFLKAVTDEARESGEMVAMEGTEAILLAAFKLLSAYFPNGLRAR